MSSRSPAVVRAIHGAARDFGDRLKNGWAYPGDTGAVDSDGFLQLMGRSSDVIHPRWRQCASSRGRGRARGA
jgi:acyl-coenzyme A synthetase/AMP-(fatty) acid ligase